MISFLQILNKEIGSTPSTSNKQIIRFRNLRDYRKFITQLKHAKHKLIGLSSVKHLGIICAVSCPVRSRIKLLQCPNALSIEEDHRMRVHSLNSNRQEAISSRNSTKKQPFVPWGVQQIKAPEAWHHSLGQRIRIGVIDTGIDFHHPDLRHNIGKGVNLIHPHMLAWDDNGHGTHIAGIIAGSSQQIGVVGVAPKAVIHPIKAFDHQGSAYVSDIIAGIDWCVQQKLPIINMSFGMKSFNKSLQQAVLQAYRSGTMIIASSGNDGRKTSLDYPARFSQVISVGATTRKKTIANFTNCSKTIDLFAPGEKIYSTWLRGDYHEMSGTSMATAHVSGVTALMLSKRPRMKPWKIKRILKQTATSIRQSTNLFSPIRQVNARRALCSLKTSKN
jgi:subtilisin